MRHTRSNRDDFRRCMDIAAEALPSSVYGIIAEEISRLNRQADQAWKCVRNKPLPTHKRYDRRKARRQKREMLREGQEAFYLDQLLDLEELFSYDDLYYVSENLFDWLEWEDNRRAEEQYEEEVSHYDLDHTYDPYYDFGMYDYDY